MKKKSVSTLLLTLVGAVYLFISVIVGILTEATEEFWMGFGFFTFATAVAVTLLLIFANSKTTIRDVFFNAPIYYIGAVYFAVSGAGGRTGCPGVSFGGTARAHRYGAAE